MESDNILTFFDKNKYDVNNKINNYKTGLNKEICSYEAINNNYEGFKYEGDYNQCYLFNSEDFNKNMNNNDKNKFKDWNMNTYLKNISTVDIPNIEDRNKNSSYFSKILNNGYISDNLINKSIVSNEDECLYKCIKEKDNCKSLIYLEQPKKCDFYKNKTMKKNNSLNKNITINKNNTINETNDINNNNSNNYYDIYTVNNNNVDRYNDKLQNILNEYGNQYEYDNKYQNQYINIYKQENINNNNEILLLYNCDGLMSTNPFCTKEFNPNENKKTLLNYSNCIDINNINNINEINSKYDEEKLFNSACKNKYGNEYIYDNDVLNIDNIINCDNGDKKVKCKLQFINNNINNNNNINIVEKFNNLEGEENNYLINIEKNNRIILIILFFILFLIIIYKITIYFNLK